MQHGQFRELHLFVTGIKTWVHWSLSSNVAYYRCKVCEEIMNEIIVFVSDDMKHRCHTVHHFVSVANQLLSNTRKLSIEREIHFSAGAASKFKSKTPFANLPKLCRLWFSN